MSPFGALELTISEVRGMPCSRASPSAVDCRKKVDPLPGCDTSSLRPTVSGAGRALTALEAQVVLRASRGLRCPLMGLTLLACCLGPCDWRADERNTGMLLR